MLRTGAKRCVVYQATQEACRLFAETFVHVARVYQGLHVWTGVIVANTSAGARTALLSDFQDRARDVGISILVNVRILREGIDIVRADCVFLKMFSNPISVVQRMMRSGRTVADMPWKRNSVFLWTSDLSDVAMGLAELKTTDPTFLTHLASVSALGYDRQGSASAKAALLANTATQLDLIKDALQLRVAAATQDERFQRQLAILAAWKATVPGDVFPPRNRTRARNGELTWSARRQLVPVHLHLEARGEAAGPLAGVVPVADACTRRRGRPARQPQGVDGHPPPGRRDRPATSTLR